jgi:hypothetical protein
MTDEEYLRNLADQQKQPLRDYFDTPFGKDQAEGIYHLTDDEVVQEPIVFDLKETVDKLAEAKDAMAQLQPTVADWRTVALARELCRTQGHDPDLMIVDVKNAARGPFGSVGVANTVPAWTLYLEAARGLSGALTNG